MYRRQWIVLEVLKAFASGAKFLSMKVKDQDKDQRNLKKMFQRKNETVDITKDPDKERLWFIRK
jgi:hypothetical protein